MADVLISYQGTFFVQGFDAHQISVLAKSKKVAGVIITVSRRKSFYCIQNLNTIKKILHGAKLSFIQLGGGIAVGVYKEQKKYYSLLKTHEMLDRRATGLVVRTTLQVCSQLFLNDNHPPQMWNVGSVLCDIIIAICMTHYVSFRVPLIVSRSRFY